MCLQGGYRLADRCCWHDSWSYWPGNSGDGSNRSEGSVVASLWQWRA